MSGPDAGAPRGLAAADQAQSLLQECMELLRSGRDENLLERLDELHRLLPSLAAQPAPAEKLKGIQRAIADLQLAVAAEKAEATRERSQLHNHRKLARRYGG